jgi:Zn-dependent peptidase ImmA (M78 family)
MHEVAHLILHRKSSIDVINNLWSQQGLERDANAFAGYLLVPDAFLNVLPRNLPENVFGYDQWLSKWHFTWGVSTEVILRRLLDAGRLSNDKYEAYRAWKASQPLPPEKEGGNREYRNREPIHIFGQRYVRTVLDALSGNHITLNKASSFLDNLKISDVRKLERHIASI